MCYASGMMHETNILEKIRAEYGDLPFTAAEAMDLLTFSELPPTVRAFIQIHGTTGAHTRRRMAEALKEYGCTVIGRERTMGRMWLLPEPDQAGRCQFCKRESGNVTYHEKTCGPRYQEIDLSRITRAGAHARPLDQLTRVQRFRRGVTDLDVARVFEMLEREEIPFHRRPSGPWVVRDPRLGLNVPVIVAEMLRTGLAREWHDENGDHLAPALVHLDRGGYSACRFPGEDLGWLRVRLVQDLVHVDCLNCSYAGPIQALRAL